MNKVLPLVAFSILLLVPLGIQNISAQPFDLTGLKSYWKFEETSGPLKMHPISEYFTDSITEVGITKTFPGKIGNAWQFGTGTTRIEIGTADDWTFLQGHQKAGWTMNFWAKSIDNGIRGAVFSNGGLSGTDNDNLVVMFDYDNSNPRTWMIDRAILPNSPFSLVGNDDVLPTDDQWHMFTLTKDLSSSAGTGNNFPFRTYVDGVLADNKNFEGNVPTEDYFVLGNQCGAFCNAWDGGAYENTPVDEWSVWSRVLDDSEISDLYNNGAGLELELNSQIIGGELIPIEVTSLILAGTQSITWIVPLVLSALGIGLILVRRKE